MLGQNNTFHFAEYPSIHSNPKIHVHRNGARLILFRVRASSIARDLPTFQYIYIYIYILPKSFRIKIPLKNKQAKNIQKRIHNQILICAKNETKRRHFGNTIKVKEIQQELSMTLSDEDMITITNVTEKARELMVPNSREKLKSNFEKLKDMTVHNKNRSIHQQQRMKEAVINLADSEIPESHRELLNLVCTEYYSYSKFRYCIYNRIIFTKTGVLGKNRRGTNIKKRRFTHTKNK